MLSADRICVVTSLNSTIYDDISSEDPCVYVCQDYNLFSYEDRHKMCIAMFVLNELEILLCPGECLYVDIIARKHGAFKVL